MLLGKKSYYKEIKVDDDVENEGRVPIGEVVYLG
jgi:hypothetical protein